MRRLGPGVADFGPVERMLRRLREADAAEVAGRRVWIEGVKRRLGLITPEDDAAARLRQWEHDHLTTEDLPVALCAGGRELDTSLMLELHDQRVSEVRSHPYLTGNEAFLFKPVPIPWPDLSWPSPGYLWGGSYATPPTSGIASA